MFHLLKGESEYAAAFWAFIQQILEGLTPGLALCVVCALMGGRTDSTGVLLCRNRASVVGREVGQRGILLGLGRPSLLACRADQALCKEGPGEAQAVS